METLKLNIRKRKTLADQLYGQILEQIVSGALAEGARLPSEHQVSEAFGVSRPVVREALRKLQEDGLVEARRGVGSFVRKRPPRGLIEFAGSGSIAGMMRAIEARMAVESVTARLAAARAGSADIARLETAFAALETVMQARAPARDEDFEFHLAVAEAAGNDVLSAMLVQTRAAVEQSMEVAQRLTRGGTQGRVDKVLREHRQILDAIRARDEEAAGLMMSYHLLQARHRITDHAREE